MRVHRLLPIFISVFLLGACATLTKDIEVKSETAPGVDMTSYKSFAWVASAEIINDPQGNWEPTDFDADAEVKFLILKELRAKGLVETINNPDLLLIFAAGIDMENLELVKDPKTKFSSLEEAPKGALLVILIDPVTRHPVWVGAAKGDANTSQTSDDVRKRLAFAVKKMFENWGQPTQ